MGSTCSSATITSAGRGGASSGACCASLPSSRGADSRPTCRDRPSLSSASRKSWPSSRSSRKRGGSHRSLARRFHSARRERLCTECRRGCSRKDRHRPIGGLPLGASRWMGCGRYLVSAGRQPEEKHPPATAVGRPWERGQTRRPRRRPPSRGTAPCSGAARRDSGRPSGTRRRRRSRRRRRRPSSGHRQRSDPRCHE